MTADQLATIPLYNNQGDFLTSGGGECKPPWDPAIFDSILSAPMDSNLGSMYGSVGMEGGQQEVSMDRLFYDQMTQIFSTPFFGNSSNAAMYTHQMDTAFTNPNQGQNMYSGGGGGGAMDTPMFGTGQPFMVPSQGPNPYTQNHPYPNPF